MYNKFSAEVTIHTDNGMHAVLRLSGNRQCATATELSEYVGGKLLEAMEKFCATHQTAEIAELRERLAALNAQRDAEKPPPLPKREGDAASPNMVTMPSFHSFGEQDPDVHLGQAKKVRGRK